MSSRHSSLLASPSGQGGKWGTSPSQLQPGIKVLGDTVCLEALELLPNCSQNLAPLLGFGYGCPGGGALDLLVCPSSLCCLLSENTNALEVVSVGHVPPALL